MQFILYYTIIKVFNVTVENYFRRIKGLTFIIIMILLNAKLSYTISRNLLQFAIYYYIIDSTIIGGRE